MKCPKCKADISEDSHFCSKCGMPLKDTADLSVSQTKTIQKPAIHPSKTIAGKYKIIEEIGRGGMGVVYKAEDTRLKRTVALKFLPAELTQDKEAIKRFTQEAQAAASLDHPNICTVFEIDEADGQTFIAMSFIDGQSLKERLEAGPLDVDEAKDIALQVAEGLKEAHERGIVHRDIKPANIMITEKGQTKITDFGLAKLSGGADLTKASAIMGTVAYMSPEQAKGEEVDHRTDIWSLGAMLYEMMSGERPFQKSQEQALIYAILNDKPTPLSLFRSEIPAHVEQVIDKALAKKSGERYKNIQELIKDLKLSEPFHQTEKSIAVLPFDDMSPGKDNEYFSDGLTEEIISDLSLVHDLLVISRSSAMTYKGTKKKIKEIGEELNVQYVLEGSVRKAGNNLKITAQLIDAKNDVHIWADKYKGTLDDVFDIQERVSSSIAKQLEIELSSQELSKMRESSLENAKAYDCYLQARYEISKGTPDSFDRARHFLQRSLDIIGDSALLYATLGQVYYWYQDYGYRSDQDPIEQAEKYAQKAYALNPNLAQIHFLFGLLERGKGNLTKAIQYIRNAVALDPNDPYILSMHIWTTAAYTGKMKKISSQYRDLLNMDPVTPVNYLIAASVFLFEGNWDEAAGFVRRSVEIDPFFRWSYFWLANIYARAQKHKEFYEVVNHILKGDSKDIIAQFIRMFNYVYQNDKQKAMEALTEDLITFGWSDPEGVWLMASYFARIGEKVQAFKWLEHAIERGWINYPLFSELDPFLENIRGEPRFKKLMERVKHEWENFEV